MALEEAPCSLINTSSIDTHPAARGACRKVRCLAQEPVVAAAKALDIAQRDLIWGTPAMVYGHQHMRWTELATAAPTSVPLAARMPHGAGLQRGLHHFSSVRDARALPTASPPALSHAHAKAAKTKDGTDRKARQVMQATARIEHRGQTDNVRLRPFPACRNPIPALPLPIFCV